MGGAWRKSLSAEPATSYCLVMLPKHPVLLVLTERHSPLPQLSFEQAGLRVCLRGGHAKQQQEHVTEEHACTQTRSQSKPRKSIVLAVQADSCMVATAFQGPTHHGISGNLADEEANPNDDHCCHISCNLAARLLTQGPNAR